MFPAFACQPHNGRSIIRDMRFARNTTRKAKYFLLLNFGLLLTAAGIALFKAPNNFAFGGTSGVSVLLASWFPSLNVGGFMWIINAALVALGYVALGRKFAGWTVYASFALSLYVTVLQWAFPMTQPFTDDLMLEMIFSVLLPATGSALVFQIGASTGGTDILAMILAKHTNLPIGKSLFVSDILIVICALFRFGPRTGLYCILGILGKTFIVDGVIESFRIRKVCTIVTHQPDVIADFVLHTLHRGATHTKADGAFSKTAVDVVVTCLTRAEALRLRRFVDEHDPKSFMTIVNSSEIIGKGFRDV